MKWSRESGSIPPVEMPPAERFNTAASDSIIRKSLDALCSDAQMPRMVKSAARAVAFYVDPDNAIMFPGAGA